MSVFIGTTLPLPSNAKSGWVREADYSDPLCLYWGFWVRRGTFEHEPEGGDALILLATDDVLPGQKHHGAWVYDEIRYRLRHCHPIRYRTYPVASIEPFEGVWLE